MMALGRIIACFTGAVALMLVWAAIALAGDYYVYGCSSYGNTAPAFQSYTDADHLTPANGCMQPAPGGGYRTLELNNPGPKAPVLHGYGADWSATTPSPAITIVGAYTPVNTVLVDCYLHSDGFTAEYFWAGGNQAIDYINGCNSYGYGYADGVNLGISPGSRYFGWEAGCWLKSSCSTSSSVGAVLGVQGIRLTAQENSGPSLLALGSNNLWYQAGRWIRSGSWPISLAASDPSGVCDMRAWVDGQLLQGPTTAPDQAVWDQCDPGGGAQQWPAAINSTSYPDGQIPFTFQAENAAQVWTTVSETVSIDNSPVSLALSTANDSDPNQWVNYPVTVDAGASAGPSGIGGTVCSTNNGPAYVYPAGGVTLDGTGVWSVSCQAWNNAIDPSGAPALSPRESVTVKIDETPPSIAFEPKDPANPTELVADTSDAQSGVAGGQMYMRPAAGGSWTPLATDFDGQHLLASFNDAGLSGPYDFMATSCDNAGNCASASEQLTLPVRLRSISDVSLVHIADALKPRVIYERVRVGWHWATVRRHGKRVRVKRGGHLKTIRVVRLVERCTHKRVKTGHHRWHERTICRPPRIVLKDRMRVPFGKPVTVYGVLITSEGWPITGAPVRILTAPDNQLGQFTQATVATTAANGSWAVTLPPGPSRIIDALYDGAATVLPAAGHATVIVPAKVLLNPITPNRTPWASTIRISGRVLGGYLPASSKLLRLDIGVVGLSQIQGIPNIAPDGRFSVTYTFNAGYGVVRFWFRVSTLAEAEYPFAPGHSQRRTVTVGVPTPLPPTATHHRAAHRRHRAHHHQKRRRR